MDIIKQTQSKTGSPIVELSLEESKQVNGGFLGALVAIAIAVISKSCATLPTKKHDDDLNY